MRQHLNRWMRNLLLSCAMIVSAPALAQEQYLVGRGRADITGETAEVGMMGYAQIDQKTTGLHQRQWARAYIVADRATDQRVVFVNTDLGMVFQSVQQGVIAKLQAKYGSRYRVDNVLLAATHTHGGPGGFSHYALYNITVLGFQKKTYDAVVDGIVRSIDRAHADLKPGRLFIGRGELTNASRNRSLDAYMRNPETERAAYGTSIDPEMTVLKFMQGDKAVGAVSWFPVHNTSMMASNKLTSPDNKGYAAYRWEHDQAGVRGNPADGFVAAFAQTNAGDLTPNLNLRPGSGPTESDVENTRILGDRQFAKAYEIFNGASEEVRGPVGARLKFVDLQTVSVAPEFGGGQRRNTCTAALGSAFAAGSTEDGPGPFDIREGNNPFLAALGTIVFGYSQQLADCQSPKQILIPTGLQKPYPWTPEVVPVQILRIGQFAILGAPGEFTVMSGRRIRNTVKSVLGPVGVNHVVLNGYANAYSNYVTTPEEYGLQNYEGGSTLFGPWTLGAYQQEFKAIAEHLRDGTAVTGSVTPRDLSCCQLNFQTGVVFDNVPASRNFGDVVTDAQASYQRGQTATVVFLTGHPKNDLHTEGSFLEVQRKVGNDWQTVANDNDWATRYVWTRVDGPLSPISHATITWAIPSDAAAGEYRIVHHGDYKNGWNGQIFPFSGASRTFIVN